MVRAMLPLSTREVERAADPKAEIADPTVMPVGLEVGWQSRTSAAAGEPARQANAGQQ